MPKVPTLFDVRPVGPPVPLSFACWISLSAGSSVVLDGMEVHGNGMKCYGDGMMVCRGVPTLMLRLCAERETSFSFKAIRV